VRLRDRDRGGPGKSGRERDHGNSGN